MRKHIHQTSPDKRNGNRTPAERYLGSLKPTGSRSQRWALAEMGRIWKRRKVKNGARLAWHRITAAEVDRVREDLASKHAPATVNRCLTALRQVLRFCWRDGKLTEDEYRRLCSVKQVRGEPEGRGRALSRTEVDRLYEACLKDGSPGGVRDLLVIALAHGLGLRRDEIVSLNLEDVETGSLVVRGKGGTVSQVRLGPVAHYLARWVELRDSAPGPLLYHVRARGKLVPQRLSAQAVYQILRKRAGQAEVDRVSPHCLRKTFATSLFRAGFDTVLVARALRHRDIRSVRAYDRRGEDEVAAAVRSAVYVPEARR